MTRARLIVVGALSLMLAAEQDASAACRVYNETYGTVRLFHGKDRSDWIDSMSWQRIKASKFDAAIANKLGNYRTVVSGTCRGTLVIRQRGDEWSLVAVPRWFKAEIKKGKLRVSAKRGGVLTVNGTEHPLNKRGRAVIDLGELDVLATLLSADVRGLPDRAVGRTVPLRVDVVSGDETVSLMLPWRPAGGAELGDSLRAQIASVATKPLSWAAAYGSAAPRPALRLHCKAGECSTGSLTGANGLQRLADVQLIAISSVGDAQVEYCRYGAWAYGISRRRHTTAVTVYRADTGKELATKTFEGGEPNKCPDKAHFTNKKKTHTIFGSAVPEADIEAFLAGQ